MASLVLLVKCSITRELFCRFCFCGHEWMLCILHATCQQIPAQFVTFFSNLAYWWPSDQSSVNVDRPIKICHVEMINCEKIRLPRQICNFCVSAVSRGESSFLFVESAFFFICLSKPPRQICNFCVSAVSRMESRFFVSRRRR
jgi:hypothetical protein